MNHDIPPRRFWPVFAVAILVALALGRSRDAFAQKSGLPFADPAKMFEQAFGEDSELDRKALEEIDVSLDEERQLGAQMVESALTTLNESEIAIETKGRNVEYLQSLVSTLKPFMRNKNRYKTIRVIVAKSPRIDARSFPGGTLIFYEGLLDSAGSEAALAGIVGHELSHLDRGHQLLTIKRVKLMEKSMTSPQSMRQFMQSGPAMTKLWSRPFRPEDERDADRDGVAWSYAAGYDPREMAKLFQKKGLKANEEENLAWDSFFRSHPIDRERHQAILTQYTQLQKQKPPKEPPFIGIENLAKRVSRNQAL